MRYKTINTAIMFCAAILMAVVTTANAQRPTLRASNQQVKTLLSRIETKTDTFEKTMDRTLDRSWMNNTNREDRIMDLISDLEAATDTLKSRYNSRQAMGGEVTEVLTKGAAVDRFMTRNRIRGAATTQWASLRTDLDTLARYYNVAWNWNGNNTGPVALPAYSVNDAQLGNLLKQIENKTDVFKRRLDNALDRSVLNNTNAEDSMNSYVADFERSTDSLRDRFNSRQSTGEDASDVLNRALYINQFMGRHRLSRAAENQWSSIRTDLNTLAGYYRVSWDWTRTPTAYPVNPPYGSGGYNNYNSDLTGTYRLNTGRSDNVSTVLDREMNRVASAQRGRMRQNLERRLASPAMIALEQRGRTITLASSNLPQVSFEADGVARQETTDRGRTMTTTATTNNNGLTINYEGDRMNDFYVTFSPRGNQLNVARRIYLENTNETITVSSVYDRISNVAQWSDVNNGAGPVYGGNTGSNDFYIPNGTRLTASLKDTIKTRVSQVGDRFTMEITSPNQYRGAIIEGRVVEAESSGRVTGRANIALDFDSVRYNNRTYRFSGIIESVNAANGDNVSVNNEGTVRDSSQTTQTATRAGIGAILGAVIGAIAGGGQGAAVGAGIGAGAGAGTVLIAGRDNIELGPGSIFTLTATAPGTTVVR